MKTRKLTKALVRYLQDNPGQVHLEKELIGWIRRSGDDELWRINAFRLADDLRVDRKSLLETPIALAFAGKKSGDSSDYDNRPALGSVENGASSLYTHAMKLSQVAVELYTVRDWLKTPAEIAESLSRIREIGYHAVQLSGLGPIETNELLKILSAEGLVCSSTHEDAAELLETPDRIAEKLDLLGCTQTAYPFPHGVSFAGMTEVKEFASRLNHAGRILNDRGITFSYHNHDIEFMRLGGRPILEILYDETDPRFVKAEIDTYWVQAGGANPVDWCRRMRERLPLLHIKDYGVNEERRAVYREIGQGNLDWPAIISAAEESGCQWYIVEQDADWADDDPFKSLQMSLDYIKANLIE